MRDLLESWGLEAVFVPEASQARELFAADPQHFDAVITDQTIPRTTGLELARELVSLKDALPVILYSGFNEGIAKAEIERSGVRAVLNKPVDPQALFALLRTHLPSRPSAASESA